jgi:poly(3-hydroxybutyrate) depolymerase
MKRLIFVALLPCLAGSIASAEVLDKHGTFGGLAVEYKVILPNGFDPSKAYPAVIALPPGGQDMRIVEGSVARNYRAEAERRGYIVAIPAAPSGQLFFTRPGDRVFPAFLDQILKDYKVQGGRFHIIGNSNGGISAFHIAALYPRYFLSLTGFPGLLEGAGASELEALKPLCISMWVGELDSGWREDMEKQAALMAKNGFRVTFGIEKGEEHVIQTLAGSGASRLFDRFDAASRGCSK